MHPVGGRVEGGLIVSVVSPLADEYPFNDGKSVLESSNEGGQIIIDTCYDIGYDSCNDNIV